MIMSVVKAVDRSLLNNAIQRCYRGLLLRRWLKNFDRRSVHRLVVHYHKNDRSLLSQLCDEHGSDKGEIKTTGHPYPWPSHTYADFYSRLFDHCRHGVKRVFECGLGTSNPDLLSSMGSGGKPGASLRVWKANFPNAQIVGADISTAARCSKRTGSGRFLSTRPGRKPSPRSGNRRVPAISTS
jgi:hypothetical protein